MIKSRALVVTAFLFLFFALLAAKLFDVQVIKYEEYKYFAQRQQTTTEKMPAQRGMIYDRNNVLLAYNRNDVSFYVDLRMAGKKDKVKIAEKFSQVFNRSKKEYLKLMNGAGKNVCIEEKAPGDKAILVKDFKAVGLFSKEDPTRVYHYGNLASHILGYLGDNYQGASGIEKIADEDLSGENGTRVIERSAIGDLITVAETHPASPGVNVYLTINKEYQNFLEEELKAGLEEYKGNSATGIIMDPNNGEVLALANIGDFDPNTFWKYPDENRRNRALTDTYEPGSTFKSVSIAALLDQHLCRENELVFVENGKYKVLRRTISDSHKHDYLTVKGVIEQSSNIGMAKLVQRMDNELYYKYLRAFGFGNITSIDLPGEVKGKLKKPSEWSGVTKMFCSFGYELAVTPIQLITAYCALVNGGVLYQPRIIKRQTDINGNLLYENSPQMVRTVISKETSAKVREFLVSAVENGTGINAKIDYMKLGGKTGTSQQLTEGKYSKSNYNTSFIGFFPADNPQIVCLILVNAPQNARYGGLVAAPIFKKIAERIITGEPQKFNTAPVNSDNRSYEYKFVKVSKNNTEIKKNSGVKDLKSGIMPDLKDLNMRDAIVVMTKLGIKYKVNGTGKVVDQSIEPGKKIGKDSVCRISCGEISEKKMLLN